MPWLLPPSHTHQTLDTIRIVLLKGWASTTTLLAGSLANFLPAYDVTKLRIAKLRLTFIEKVAAKDRRGVLLLICRIRRLSQWADPEPPNGKRDL